MRQPRDVITQMCTAETCEMRRFRRVGNCHSFVGERAIWKSKSLKTGISWSRSATLSDSFASQASCLTSPRVDDIPGAVVPELEQCAKIITSPKPSESFEDFVTMGLIKGTWEIKANLNASIACKSWLMISFVLHTGLLCLNEVSDLLTMDGCTPQCICSSSVGHIGKLWQSA